ncbi:hypothetical protein GUJ93_ZPchr0007g4898 [Zizania palustris]|uniref:Uncharacterized protein n=1 Tax=Zizania palustris TaxID=103762 RepID=A0A8J5W4D5_ZIZPA|nr:hypothetical protein GUJ93_ZPchr0007g4898 [Zizania palustris]
MLAAYEESAYGSTLDLKLGLFTTSLILISTLNHYEMQVALNLFDETTTDCDGYIAGGKEGFPFCVQLAVMFAMVSI